VGNKKLKIITFAFCFLIAVVGGTVFYIYADDKNFWRVVDPLDPRFNPDKFAFNNYDNNAELAEVLKVLISPEMPRHEAEKFLDGSPDKKGGDDRTNDEEILTGRGVRQNVNVEMLREKSNRIVSYGHGGRRKILSPLFGGWNVTAFYDEQDRIIQLIVRDEPLFDEGKL